MKTEKKWIAAVFLALILSFAVPGIAAVSGFGPGAAMAAEETEAGGSVTGGSETGGSGTGGSATVEPETEPTEADGWHRDGNGWYYVQNNKRYTGLRRVGSEVYYFNANGYRQSGIIKVNQVTYYFRADGRLLTGVSGLARLKSDGSVYCYFMGWKNGTLAASRWVKVNGKMYYADANARITFGTQKINGKLYHITKAGWMTSYGKSSYDGKYYYPAKNGVLKTGFQTINKKLYYFSPVTGERMTGTVKIGSYTYYFYRTNGSAYTGWGKHGSQYYYYQNGRRLTGLTTVNKKKYYFDPAADGARATNKWVKYGGKYWMYFGSNGVVKTGFFTVNNRTFYANPSTGYRKTGMLTINGRKYYFYHSYGYMRTGWTTYNGKKYYLNPTKSSSTYGAAKTGWNKISGSWYYFNQDGTMKTGWLLQNMRYYYLDKTTGKMLTGRQKIDGKYYNFGTQGWFKAEISGSWRIEVNRKNCFIVVYKGNTEVNAFVCSTAADRVSTPTGTFTLLDKLRWHELNGPSWGQYCSHITWNILFHSVPCSRYNDNRSLKAAEFNKLGTPASGGCIRLTVKHAKWLYDNCPVGTKVIISDSVAKPKTISIEQAPKIPLTQNYDPTDPNI